MTGSVATATEATATAVLRAAHRAAEGRPSTLPELLTAARSLAGTRAQTNRDALTTALVAAGDVGRSIVELTVRTGCNDRQIADVLGWRPAQVAVARQQAVAAVTATLGSSTWIAQLQSIPTRPAPAGLHRLLDEAGAGPRRAAVSAPIAWAAAAAIVAAVAVQLPGLVQTYGTPTPQAVTVVAAEPFEGELAPLQGDGLAAVEPNDDGLAVSGPPAAREEAPLVIEPVEEPAQDEALADEAAADEDGLEDGGDATDGDIGAEPEDPQEPQEPEEPSDPLDELVPVVPG